MKTIDLPYDADGLPVADLIIDWKESPDEVLEAVNKLLAARGISAEFVALRSDDDQYYFNLKSI
jgi:hypothetical protein